MIRPQLVCMDRIHLTLATLAVWLEDVATLSGAWNQVISGVILRPYCKIQALDEGM